MNPPRDLTGVILAGGSSRRMGQPKAGLTLPDGRTLLEASADALRRVADDVVIIGAPTIETNFDVIPDDTPGDGPLAAVATALRSKRAARYLVIPCDMPRLRAETLRDLAASDATLAAYRTADGQLQPLPLLVGARMRGRVDDLLADGVRSLHRLLAEADARIIPTDAGGFDNINTPDDFSRLG